MAELATRKRLEVIVDMPLSNWLADEAEAAGITHFTILPTLGGKGVHGRWTNDGVAGGKCVFVAVTSIERMQLLIERIGPLLGSYRIVMDIADVQVVRGERF